MVSSMELILHPIAYYGLTALGLVLCLYLFISLKKENAELRRKLERHNDCTLQSLGQFRSALSNLERVLQELEPTESLQDTPRLTMSINLTKRSQALRMYRRGETPEQIAAALQLPRNEVDLLLKVHQSVATQV